MAENDISLTAVLGLEQPPDDNAVTQESVRKARELVEEAIADSPLLKPWDVTPAVVAELLRVLDTPLKDIAVNAWNKRDEIRKYGDPARTPPDETNEVWLYEHELQQTLKPSVQIRVAGVPVAKLVFTAKVTLTFHGAMLVIRGGRITHVRLGDLSAEAKLTAGKLKVLKHTIAKKSLPDRLKLGSGIPIGGGAKKSQTPV